MLLSLKITLTRCTFDQIGFVLNFGLLFKVGDFVWIVINKLGIDAIRVISCN
jgi:hypothetical protein